MLTVSFFIIYLANMIFSILIGKSWEMWFWGANALYVFVNDIPSNFFNSSRLLWFEASDHMSLLLSFHFMKASAKVCQQLTVDEGFLSGFISEISIFLYSIFPTNFFVDDTTRFCEANPCHLWPLRALFLYKDDSRLKVKLAKSSLFMWVIFLKWIVQLAY